MADFRSGQILYLEHRNTRLYAEVIQVIEERGMCWVRPIALTAIPGELLGSNPSPLPSSRPNSGTLPEAIDLPDPADLLEFSFYDLRQGADLLCPSSLFTAALDTDVLPILATLNALKAAPDSSATTTANPHSHSRLQNFIQELWQAYPEAFHV
ncbi:hypothetical protein [Egbenema bharatensis]|uniref:hypothetical protein n=1 Tax=Egbenema bharatensis TaxID=3463334 RepID=UPI003A87B022